MVELRYLGEIEIGRRETGSGENLCGIYKSSSLTAEGENQRKSQTTAEPSFPSATGINP